MTLTIREPGSAATHFAGVIMTVLAGLPMLVYAGRSGRTPAIWGSFIFVASMLLLYTASTVYHSLTVRPRILRIFRKMDHMMVFVLIAGSYTPFCLMRLDFSHGKIMLAAVWGLALAGMLMKACWVTCPKWFSSVIYIAMGWVCIPVLPQLLSSLSAGEFAWLLAGGIIYTVGGVIYALRPALLPPMKNFGNHELFHLFVMGGSFCHIVCMFLCIHNA